MASLIPELAIEEALGLPEPALTESRPRRNPLLRIRYWRGAVMLVAAAYFLFPLYAGLAFGFENDYNRPSLGPVEQLPHQSGFPAAFFLSLRLVLVTTGIVMIMMIPTATYVHLKLPRMRRALDFVTILPIVIPPIVLIIGVMDAAPLWARSSPYLLSFEYVILAYPFVYRSLDAGLTAIDLKTLVEASRSLGGRSLSTLLRVVVPNLRAAIMSGLVLTLALVLGEFTMAQLADWTTLPVWIYNFRQEDAHITTAAAMLSLVGTWVLITAIVFLDPQARRSRRKQLA